MHSTGGCLTPTPQSSTSVTEAARAPVLVTLDRYSTAAHAASSRHSANVGKLDVSAKHMTTFQCLVTLDVDLISPSINHQSATTFTNHLTNNILLPRRLYDPRACSVAALRRALSSKESLANARATSLIVSK